ncbi:MAG: relaxase/mobilization nuclease domain-containing protein [Lachnospiraceae bacterium]|nr:relaxase/mobilization nuclease domain-containing protein [Lachnospiraceae bacterium]
MAINKVVNKSTKSHGAMRNVLEYVLRDEKVKEGYVFIEGPYDGDSINYDEVYQTWIREKQIWDKDSGRMYAHNIISFHKDEKITPEEVLEIGKAYAEKFFPEHQYVISVHQDKDHLHCHIVVNSVSYIDGRKLHQTKKDLEKQKEFTNDLCRERGLSIAEKGHHFDGSLIEQGEITAWNKDKYNLLINNTKQSFVADCAIALMEAIPQSASREEFISGMKQRGWSVQWEEKRKHIAFQNENGNKVRDSNIEKTFAGMEVNKEALTHEFERQNEHRISERRSDTELSQYYDELESAIAGLDIAKTVRDNSEAGRRDTELVHNSIRPAGTTGSDNAGMGAPKGPGQAGRHRDDTETLIADIRADISNSRSQSRAVVRAENQSLADEEQRRLEEQRRVAIEERAREARRRAHQHSGPSL